MAEISNIAWTKSTFNPWIGCTKVSPGCDGCYAEALDKRMKFGGAVHWGAGVPRYRTSASNWAKPLAWNKAAPSSEFAGRKGFWPVFCASLGDVFDNEIPQEWRRDLFNLIETTPNLSWLLVTKRIGNVKDMVPLRWRVEGFPPNVRILITAVNQEEADRDIPKLLALPCKRGISYEPALGPINFREINLQLVRGNPFTRETKGKVFNATTDCLDPILISWVIVGGESSQPGHPARPFNIEWARDTVRQCRDAGVPVFVKQLGARPWFGTQRDGEPHIIMVDCKDRAGADPAEWPDDIRVREFPA